MKLSSRRRREPEEAPADDAPPPPPGPPRGSPVAAYAGILDGGTLWLAVEATPGTLALRDDAGDVHPLPSDLAEDDPDFRSVRADLLGLPGDDEAGYDVVLVPTGGPGPQPVWIAPFPPRPTRVPPSPDGRWQLALRRTDEGFLRVRRDRPAPGFDVLDLAVDGAGVRIVFAGEAGQVALVEDETMLASYPVSRDGDRSTVVVTEGALPEGTGQLGGLLADGTPLRRRANDLAGPHQAVLLPVLFGDDLDIDRLRLRWSSDAHLVARIVDPEEARGDG